MAYSIQNNNFLNRACEWGLKNPGKATAIITITAAVFSILAIIAASYIPNSMHLHSALPPLQPITAAPFNMFNLFWLTPVALGILYYVGSKTWDNPFENDTFKRAWTYCTPARIFQTIAPIEGLPVNSDLNITPIPISEEDRTFLRNLSPVPNLK